MLGQIRPECCAVILDGDPVWKYNCVTLDSLIAIWNDVNFGFVLWKVIKCSNDG